MAVHCDYCNEEATGRAYISDDRSTSVAYCGVHRAEALKNVETQKSKRDNAEVPNIATVIRDTVVGVDTLPNGKTITHVLAETLLDDKVMVTDSSDPKGFKWVDRKALSDEEAEKWANRLWDFLEPKVQKLIDESWDIDKTINECLTSSKARTEPIMSPDGKEIRGYTSVPEIGPPPDHLIEKPKVDIMDRYGLWSDNYFEEWLAEPVDEPFGDLEALSNQLRYSRRTILKLHEDLENAKREIQSLSKVQV